MRACVNVLVKQTGMKVWEGKKKIVKNRIFLSVTPYSPIHMASLLRRFTVSAV